MDLEAAVRGLCEEGGLEADILRVLAAQNGVSWGSEVSIDLVEMYDFLGTSPQASEKDVESALKKLASEGLVSLEKRKRGSGGSGEPVNDVLVGVNDLRGLRLALAGDEVYRRYSYARYTRIKDALEGRSEARGSINRTDR